MQYVHLSFLKVAAPCRFTYVSETIRVVPLPRLTIVEHIRPESTIVLNGYPVPNMSNLGGYLHRLYIVDYFSHALLYTETLVSFLTV
jgi:hypothetical protein